MPRVGTRQSKFFAECQTGGTRQRGRRWMPLGPYQSLPSVCLCRVPGSFAEAKASLPSVIFCRVRRSAKQVFIECLKFDTRQRFLHSANHVFPVVSVLLHSSHCCATVCSPLSPVQCHPRHPHTKFPGKERAPKGRRRGCLETEPRKNCRQERGPGPAYCDYSQVRSTKHSVTN